MNQKIYSNNETSSLQQCVLNQTQENNINEDEQKKNRNKQQIAIKRSNPIFRKKELLKNQYRISKKRTDPNFKQQELLMKDINEKKILYRSTEYVRCVTQILHESRTLHKISVDDALFTWPVWYVVFDNFKIYS